MHDAPVIAVGVDRGRESRCAALWAADRVHRYRGRLVLAHAIVPPSYAAVTTVGLELLPDLSQAVIDSVTMLVTRRYPGIPLSTVMSSTLPVTLLEEVSGSTDAVVLGRRDRRRRAWAASGIAAELPGRSTCPVITVPRCDRPPTRGPVVAVVEALGDAQLVVDRAISYARTAGHSVVVLTVVPDGIATAAIPETYSATEELVDRSVGPDSGVDVRVQIISVTHHHGVADAVTGASMFVVGHPRRHEPRTAWMRSTARALTRSADIPVAVV